MPQYAIANIAKAESKTSSLLVSFAEHSGSEFPKQEGTWIFFKTNPDIIIIIYVLLPPVHKKNRLCI